MNNKNHELSHYQSDYHDIENKPIIAGMGATLLIILPPPELPTCSSAPTSHQNSYWELLFQAPRPTPSHLPPMVLLSSYAAAACWQQAAGRQPRGLVLLLLLKAACFYRAQLFASQYCCCHCCQWPPPLPVQVCQLPC
jgi:hypothetical protein